MSSAHKKKHKKGTPGAIKLVGNGFSLDQVDLGGTLDTAAYEQRLGKVLDQLRLVQLSIRHADARGIVVFEGWDAAGKGGTIRRMTSLLDPRAFTVWPIGVPEQSEQGKHYLYRFWTKLPARKTIAVFDRSWYGRVLVERVEGLAREAEWRRAYDEINGFEKALTDDGVRIIKLYMHISPEEQLRRFESRLHDPLKRWKLTLDDLRNRSLWSSYEKAVEEMLGKTSTDHAPWRVVPMEDKKYGRVLALEVIADELARGLDLSPPPVADEILRGLEEELQYAGRK